MNTDKINTAIRMIVELINALPIPAFLKALTKFSKYSQLDGGVITFVLLYSASVLKAVITQETSGIIATREKKTRDAYFKKIRMNFLICPKIVILSSLLLCSKLGKLLLSLHCSINILILRILEDILKEQLLCHCHNQNNR